MGTNATHKPVRWHGVANGNKAFWDAVVPLLCLTIRLTRPPVWQVNIYPLGATIHRTGKPNPWVMNFDVLKVMPRHPGLVPGNVVVQAFPVRPPCPN